VSGTISIATPTNASGAMRVQSDPREGSKVQVISQNFCDKHTWYSDSTRRIAQPMLDTGDGLTFALASPMVGVDVSHARIMHERRLRPQYAPVVRVDGVALVEKDLHDLAGDFSVDYETMRVTFDVSQVGKGVEIDFSEVGSSAWLMTPAPGKILRLLRVELQFSTDVDMNDTFMFQPRGDVAKFPALSDLWDAKGGAYPAGTMLPLGEPTCYQTVFDLVTEANLSYPIIPKSQTMNSWRNLAKDVGIFSWNYSDQATIDLRSSLGMDIKVSLEHDIPYGGFAAVATFYGLSEDESI
jgi:hypothetical protein